MEKIHVGFSINMHDKDGDKYDDCILLHFNDTFLLRLADKNALDDLINTLQSIKKEINETT